MLSENKGYVHTRPYTYFFPHFYTNLIYIKPIVYQSNWNYIEQFGDRFAVKSLIELSEIGDRFG
jgi:hypothetical protein